MMISIKCSSCQGDISIHLQYVGDIIQCPYCGALQIVPDQLLEKGSEFDSYVVQSVISTSALWTAYEVAAQPNNLALHIPTIFFLKGISDISSFADAVISSSSLNRPELPALLSHSISPQAFFVFDYQADAVKLSSIVNDRPMDTYSALRVVRNVASCLKFLWDEHGVLHQCLIPDNIWMNPGFNIRIKNTGMSSHLLADLPLLESGFNIWDYHYISPEFMNEGIADTPACDIYSLGGILFYLCTGSNPNEGVPPELVASTLTPSLSDLLPEAPHGLSVLVQLMMSPDISLRPGSWDEVLTHIDILLANQVRPSDIPFNFPSALRMTGHHQPVGMSPGDLTQSIKRAEALDPPGGGRRTSAHKTIKPIAKSSLSTMDKRWKKKRRGKPAAKDHVAAEGKQPTTRKKNDNTPVVIVISVAALVAAIAIAFVIINSSKPKQKPSRTAPSPAMERGFADSESAYERQMELLRRQGIDPKAVGEKKSQSPSPPASPARSDTRPKPTRTRQTGTDDSQEAVISRLTNQAKPLLDTEKHDEAIRLFLEYDGELAEETMARRMVIIDRIKSRIPEIHASDAPDAGQQAENPEEILRKVATQIAPLLFKGQTSLAKQQIDAAAITAGGGMLKENLESLSSELASFERLKPQLQGHAKAESLVNAPENKELTDNAFLLQGLLYREKEQFLQAKLAFEKTPHNLGSIFVAAMEKSIVEE